MYAMLLNTLLHPQLIYQTTGKVLQVWMTYVVLQQHFTSELSDEVLALIGI